MTRDYSAARADARLYRARRRARFCRTRGVAGLDGQRAFERGRGLVDPPRLRQHDAETVQEARAVGRDLESRPDFGERVGSGVRPGRAAARDRRAAAPGSASARHRPNRDGRPRRARRSAVSTSPRFASSSPRLLCASAYLGREHDAELLRLRRTGTGRAVSRNSAAASSRRPDAPSARPRLLCDHRQPRIERGGRLVFGDRLRRPPLAIEHRPDVVVHDGFELSGLDRRPLTERADGEHQRGARGQFTGRTRLDERRQRGDARRGEEDERRHQRKAVAAEDVEQHDARRVEHDDRVQHPEPPPVAAGDPHPGERERQQDPEVPERLQLERPRPLRVGVLILGVCDLDGVHQQARLAREQARPAAGVGADERERPVAIVGRHLAGPSGWPTARSASRVAS